MINIKINEHELEVEEGSTILDVAKRVNVNIPTLCHLELKDFGVVNDGASCRVCMVEVEGRANLIPACSTKVYDGMKIKTDSIRAIMARRKNQL